MNYDLVLTWLQVDLDYSAKTAFLNKAIFWDSGD